MGCFRPVRTRAAMSSASMPQRYYEFAEVSAPVFRRVRFRPLPQRPAAADQIVEHGTWTDLEEGWIGELRRNGFHAFLPTHRVEHVGGKTFADERGRRRVGNLAAIMRNIGGLRSGKGRRSEHRLQRF